MENKKTMEELANMLVDMLSILGKLEAGAPAKTSGSPKPVVENRFPSEEHAEPREDNKNDPCEALLTIRGELLRIREALLDDRPQMALRLVDWLLDGLEEMLAEGE